MSASGSQRLAEGRTDFVLDTCGSGTVGVKSAEWTGTMGTPV